jgi:hypothetical protein
MDAPLAVCSTHQILLNAEVNAWSLYWSKFYERSTPKAGLDRLMDAAASAALKTHTDQCSICRTKRK